MSACVAPVVCASNLPRDVSSSPNAAERTKQQHVDANTAGKKDAVPANRQQHTNTTAVKVSNINVTDERLHLSMIALLGCVLSQLVAFEESQYPAGRGSISMFTTMYVPSITIGSYLKRIALYTKVSTEVLIQSVLHVHQLMQRTQNPLIVNKLNIHRLLLTSIMATAKFFDDAHYNNAYYSYVGGVPLKELNALEVEFLSLLNFDFYVNSMTYQYFYSMVVERNIHQNGCHCSSLLLGLPKLLPVNDYVPCAEPDFLDVPCSPSGEDIHMLVESEARSSSVDMVSPSPSNSDSTSGSSVTMSSVGSCTTASTVSSTPNAAHVVVVVPPNSAMDDMGDELGSIRIEEDSCIGSVNMSATPQACSATMCATPEAPKHVRTPRQLPAQALHTQLHHRSASPASFLSASTSALESPVSSVGSYSSFSTASYPSRMPQHSSPSLSLSLSNEYTNAHGRYASVVEEESVSAYLVSTPKQSSATPLACTMKVELERKEREMNLEQARIIM
jgi:hypothetical protein